MSFRRERGRQQGPVRVCVIHHPRGCWEVVPLNGRGRIPCETLEDARRIAYLSVAHASDCELIVRDAYHRVLERGLIHGRGDGPADSRSTSEA